jgi:tetratricopeptide (TPR) repeat protein
MKCQECDKKATENRGWINGLGEDLGKKYDHLCATCSEDALENFQSYWKRMLTTLKSPENNLKNLREEYEGYDEKQDVDEMIGCLDSIATYEAQLGNYLVAREEISKALELNLGYSCKERECSLTYILAKIEKADGNETKSLAAWKHALELKRKIKTNPTLAKSKWSIDFVDMLTNYAKYLMNLEQFEEAEPIWREAFQEWTYSNLRDKKIDRRVEILIRWGEIFEKLDRGNELLEVYGKAIQIIEENEKDVPSWLIEKHSQLVKSEEE